MIRADGLTKRFGDATAVDGVGFTAARGELLCLVGNGGAGRTTTVRMLLGLVRPTEGTALVLDRPYAELPDASRRVGALIGDGLHPRRSARNHLRVVAATLGVDGDRVSEVLEVAGLDDVAREHTLALDDDQRQRLRIASALLADPEVLILDEPDLGLGREGTLWLTDLLGHITESGGTVLCSCGPRSRLIDVAAEMVVLDRGKPVGGRAGPQDERHALPGKPVEDADDGLDEAERDATSALEGRVVGPGRLLAVAAAGSGRGGTTMSLLLADALGEATGCSTLVLGLASDGELLRHIAADPDRSPLGVGDLLEDLASFDEHAVIEPYVSQTASGPHTLAGWASGGSAQALRPRQVQDVAAFAQRFYDLVVLDIGDAPPLALVAAIRAADEVVLVDTPEGAEGPVAGDVMETVEREVPQAAILVLNQVRRDAGRAFAGRAPHGRHGAVPADPALKQMLAGGTLDRSRLQRATRVAVQRTATVVADGLAS